MDLIILYDCFDVLQCVFIVEVVFLLIVVVVVVFGFWYCVYGLCCMLLFVWFDMQIVGNYLCEWEYCYVKFGYVIIDLIIKWVVSQLWLVVWNVFDELGDIVFWYDVVCFGMCYGWLYGGYDWVGNFGVLMFVCDMMLFDVDEIL